MERRLALLQRVFVPLVADLVADPSSVPVLRVPRLRVLRFHQPIIVEAEGRVQICEAGKHVADLCGQPQRFLARRPPFYGRGSGNWDVARLLDRRFWNPL
jgi:hypothetical protein